MPRGLFTSGPYHVPGCSVRFGHRTYHSRYGRPPQITRNKDNELVVKVEGGQGHNLTLRIHRAPRPNVDSPIIIYFKSGMPTSSTIPSCLKELALGASATAVEISYTVSRENPYPSPIHKTLAGYDWVQKYLARGKVLGYEQLGASTKPPKIGVCGDLVGGSLATMLALTECRTPASNRGLQPISAVAVGNPILDWTALFDSTSDRLGSRYSGNKLSRKQYQLPPTYDNQILTVPGLVDVRSVYFNKPETYFDPFASPLLFFRTPSADLPNETQVASGNGSSSDSEVGGGPSEPVKKRRSHRKFPPTGIDLVLPHMRMEVGKDCVLKDQGIEMIELVRKSFKRTEEEMKSVGKSMIDRSFEVIEKEGLDLWKQEHMLEIGQWFGDILRRP